MQLSEFNDHIEKAIQEKRYLEAFALKSLYIESIITVLATAKRFHKLGFDGSTLSVKVEVERDPNSRQLFKDSMEDKLSNNIGVLRQVDTLEKNQADYLYTWKDRYRDVIFHRFGELLLSGTADSLAQKGFEFTQRFTNQEWFKKMEEVFQMAEQEMIRLGKNPNPSL